METDNSLNIEALLSQEQLQESITTCTELFDAYYEEAEKCRLFKNGATLEARHESSEVVGQQDDPRYDKQQLKITLQNTPDQGNIYTITKFAPDKAATWRLTVMNVISNQWPPIGYEILKKPRSNQPGAPGQRYSLSLSHQFKHPSLDDYQTDMKNLKSFLPM